MVLVLPSPAALGERYARHLLSTARDYLQLAPSLGERHVPIARAVARAVARRPKDALACFASPTVATPIRCAPLAADLPAHADRIARSLDALGPHLLFELSLRSLFLDGETVDWPDPVEALRSPSLGLSLVPPPGPLRFSSGAVDGEGGARFTLDGERRGFAVSPSWLPLAGVTRLALADENPLASLEAHPDKTGNALDLGGRPVDEWCASLERAIALATAHLPGLRDELVLLLHEIVPVGFDAERHLSASYREALGTIYLSLHPDPITMAEALVHEFQHTKLNLLSYSDPLLENAFEPLFKSPIRPDPRPLWGILLAAHAFLPVAVMHRAFKDSAKSRLQEIDRDNREAMEMLRAHGRFTPAGAELFAALDALDRAHMG